MTMQEAKNLIYSLIDNVSMVKKDRETLELALKVFSGEVAPSKKPTFKTPKKSKLTEMSV